MDLDKLKEKILNKEIDCVKELLEVARAAKKYYENINFDDNTLSPNDLYELVEALRQLQKKGIEL